MTNRLKAFLQNLLSKSQKQSLVKPIFFNNCRQDTKGIPIPPSDRGVVLVSGMFAYLKYPDLPVIDLPKTAEQQEKD
jgi:hypothetical protein